MITETIERDGVTYDLIATGDPEHPTTPACKHPVLDPEVKEQLAVKNVLLLQDCAICDSTITTGTRGHTPEERQYIERLRRAVA